MQMYFYFFFNTAGINGLLQKVKSQAPFCFVLKENKIIFPIHFHIVFSPV